MEILAISTAYEVYKDTQICNSLKPKLQVPKNLLQKSQSMIKFHGSENSRTYGSHFEWEIGKRQAVEAPLL